MAILSSSPNKRFMGCGAGLETPLISQIWGEGSPLLAFVVVISSLHRATVIIAPVLYFNLDDSNYLVATFCLGTHYVAFIVFSSWASASTHLPLSAGLSLEALSPDIIQGGSFQQSRIMQVGSYFSSCRNCRKQLILPS